MSASVRPHRRQPTRLPRPWDSPDKITGVGCHFLLQNHTLLLTNPSKNAFLTEKLYVEHILKSFLYFQDNIFQHDFLIPCINQLHKHMKVVGDNLLNPVSQKAKYLHQHSVSLSPSPSLSLLNTHTHSYLHAHSQSLFPFFCQSLPYKQLAVCSSNWVKIIC